MGPAAFKAIREYIHSPSADANPAGFVKIESNPARSAAWRPPIAALRGETGTPGAAVWAERGRERMSRR